MQHYIVLLAVVLVPLLLVGTIGFIAKWRAERDGRRSPIGHVLMNLPGEQLRQRIADLDERLSMVLVVAIVSTPLGMLVWLTQPARGLVTWPERFNAGDLMLLVQVLCMLGAATAYAIRIALRMRRARQGLAAEIAVAQGLQSLIAEGCMVFHDVPADGFNLDHVVVGPSAVFLVETKSRRKPRERGKASARVVYDGQRLRFPEHVESKPLEQARHEARWLSEFLEGAAGEKVRVVPVVALPGWYVENGPEIRGRQPEVWVTNARNPAFMHKVGFGPPLAPDLRRRVAYALTRRYGEVDADA